MDALASDSDLAPDVSASSMLGEDEVVPLPSPQIVRGAARAPAPALPVLSTNPDAGAAAALGWGRTGDEVTLDAPAGPPARPVDEFDLDPGEDKPVQVAGSTSRRKPMGPRRPLA